MELANKVAAIAKRTLPVSGVFDEVSAAGWVGASARSV